MPSPAIASTARSTRVTVRLEHDERIDADADRVWQFFRWDNLAAMRSGGFFVEVGYEDTVLGANPDLNSESLRATELAVDWRAQPKLRLAAVFSDNDIRANMVRRLAQDGLVPDGSLSFITAA